MNILKLLIAAVILCAATTPKKDNSDVLPSAEEQVFDFGHVGIDYTIYHSFPFENRTDDTIRIISATSNCGCGHITVLDSIVAPDDTTNFRLRYSTKNLYGKIKRSFTIITDHSILDTLTYKYLSNVGQWFSGLRPEPAALIFLPKKTTQTVHIPNRKFDVISLSKVIQYDSSFSIKVNEDRAKKGSALVLEIKPLPDIKTGTYVTNATLYIKTDEDSPPTILTLPIKIIRY
ncbi:MAG: DUF1573 domain-containing protein [candidate division Zixibacteria bacterium]|nr:DUF1573 domain-containing protein [candidate division Zixibacteria bacterium]